MQNYTDFSYGNDEDNKLWSSFIHQSNGGMCNEFNTPLYSSIFSITPLVPEYHRLSSKEAEALRQENVNLQMMNSELNKQLSQLQQVSVSDSVPVSSVANCFGRMRIGEKGSGGE
ncbi:hypothetical protein HanRHA438_Chr00c16g0850691 [Helianthus annuus]|nr:hypothetical protein HanRHA438_Chr00c16g0850691 [Helianthus annuus]